METASVYLPMDRRQALSRGTTLPEHSHGAALFADISGFTPLTEALVQELGPRRGAEELTRHLNRVYDALIAELHRYGGSVVGFSGDAITCWLDGDDGSRATACALAMQQAMVQFLAVGTTSGGTVSLAMKAAVAAGMVRRFVVGDPHCCLVDVMAGRTLDNLAAAEQVARKREVVLDGEALVVLGSQVDVVEWRVDQETGKRFGVVAGLHVEVPDAPWPALPPHSPANDQVRPWLLPAVYQRLASGQGEFLAELRPAVTLFLRFGGIDYDCDLGACDRLNTFMRGVQGILTRYDASLLALTIGDKGSYLSAAFGAPVAHEDDAARAASAALELQTMARGLDYLTGPQIGIAMGRMRTGAYGSRTRRTYGVMGDAVNLSARLMAAAEPGQILVSERARAAAGEGFAWEALPPIEVKGKSEPVTLARLTGLKRQQVIHFLEPRYALRMVGRRAELATIEQKLGLVLQGKGQIIGITGEAGMGKSRLAAEAIRRTRGQGLMGYGGECQSYGTGTSYLVWRSIWLGFFGVDAAAPLEDQIRSLQTQLGEIGARLVSRLPLLGSVLNLPIPDNDLTRGLEARIRKSSLEALLVDCLRARAREHPLLLVLEDCHWLDPLSQDLIEEISRAIADLPVLMLVVYRPADAQCQPAQRLKGLAHFTEITLREFTPQEAERLIRMKLRRFLGSEAEVPPDFLGQITQRAAGNPFFIEELLNYLQDRDIRPEDREALAALDLPSSLYSLVLSRIDQLTESQQTCLKVASVIGRLFSAAMVWGVYPQQGSLERIEADLQVLSALDLTPLATPEPELTYLFKHIITHEVAYESLLYATRAMLHEQVGLFVENTYSQTLDQFLNLLAFHYEHSENQSKKKEYLLKAGQAAQADYANAAAIEYYQKALPLLADQERVSVLLNLGKVRELVGDWQPAAERYTEALALARDLGDWRGEAWCETAMAELHRKQGDYDQAAACLARARAGFERMGDAAGVGQVLHYAGTMADQRGDYSTARSYYEESLAIRQQLGDKRQSAYLLGNLGIVARRQGDLPLAQKLYELALSLRRELEDRWGIANSLNNLGNLALDLEDLARARTCLEEAVAIHRELGDRWMIANALNNLGNVARAQGDYAAAGALYNESLEIYRVLGDRWALAYLFEDLGWLAALEGDARRALYLAGAAEALREQIGAPLTPTESAKMAGALQAARQALDPEAQTLAWATGKAMPLEQAIQTVLTG